MQRWIVFCGLGSPVLECGLGWRLLEAVLDVANCRGSNSGSWPAWRLLAPSASLILMVSSADWALDEQFRIFQAFVSGKDTWPYSSMIVPFDYRCVPCGEVTMRISRTLLVLEMFLLYLIQGYKSVLFSGIPVLSRDVSYVLLTGWTYLKGDQSSGWAIKWLLKAKKM